MALTTEICNTYHIVVIAQVSPKLLIVSESSDELLLNFLQEEYGKKVKTWLHVNLYSYTSSGLGTSIEIEKVLGKDFVYEKGRYLLLNWFINHIQNSAYNLNNITGEDTFDDEKIVLIDPQEGNKTHAFLQLESVINLEKSKLTVRSNAKICIQNWPVF